MRESREKTTSELRMELRQLRQTVHELADAVDELADNQGQGRGQGGPPEWAQNAKGKAQQARDVAGPPVPEDEQIDPDQS
jgi:hypothetical protein